MFQPLYVKSLNTEEIEALKSQADSRDKTDAWRAEVVLLSAAGKNSAEISQALGFHISNVKKWIRKFNEEGLDGLAARKRGPRNGPKPMFSRTQVDGILALARTDPAELNFPFRKWTPQKIAIAAIDRGIVDTISHVTVRQILRRNGDGAIASIREEPSSFSGFSRSERFSTKFDLGIDAFRQSAFREAVDYFCACLEHNSPSPDEEALTRCFLSQSLGELMQYEEAYRAIERYDDPNKYQALPPSSRARVKLRIGAAYAGVKNYPKAIATLNDAKKLFLELQDDLGISETHYNLGKSYAQLNEFRIARDHLETAVSYQRTIQDRELLARIYDKLGFVDFGEGAFSSSYDKFRTALEYADGLTNPSLLGTILVNLGTTYDEGSLGAREQSSVYFKQAIENLERGGQKDLLALAYNNLADNLRDSGSWDEALAILKRAIALGDEYPDANVRAMAYHTIAEILCARGDLDEAAKNINRGLELVEGKSDKWLESNLLRLLARVHCVQGIAEDSLKELRTALRLSTAIGDLHGVTLAQVGLAETHFEQGGFEQAREYLELAQARLKEEESLFISGLMQRLAGRLEAEAGRFVEARQHVSQSISIFTTTDVPYEAARSHYAMGRVLFADQDLGGARGHLEKAREVFESLAAAPELQMTLAALHEILDFQSTVPASVRSDLTSAEESRRISLSLPASPDSKRIEMAVDDRNDVLLMQRLIEASASRELLLQELASVIVESFPVAAVIVYRLVNQGPPQVALSEGISLTEAELVVKGLDARLIEEGGQAEDGYMFLLGIVERDAFVSPRPGQGPSLAVYVRFQKGANANDRARILDRLQPLMRQAELGLEMCSLRAASRVTVSSVVHQKTKTVMPGFIVGSASMFDVIDKIHKIRTSDVTVLITGESGTGKELVARAIHKESARAGGIFLPFNCTATPRDLIDSQLFGHRRGSFTGAITNYPGITRAADGGTLFLDEIGDLALEVQPKLMRFLQEGEIQPLGETKPVKVDVRVLAATNSNLERAVEEGRFREDLFHRLNIIRIHVPPLRERKEEIPILASHFLEHFCTRSGKQGIALGQHAINALSDYDWPGNVRQLRNEIERVIAYAVDSSQVEIGNLSPEITGPRRSVGPMRNLTRPGEVSKLSSNGSRAAWFAGSLQDPLAKIPDSFPSLDGPVKLRDATSALERQIITNSLSRNRNNLSRTALELGLSRRGLRLKLAQLGIVRESS